MFLSKKRMGLVSLETINGIDKGTRFMGFTLDAYDGERGLYCGFSRYPGMITASKGLLLVRRPRYGHNVFRHEMNIHCYQ